MWHFCLALDPLHLCAEREFDTSQSGYTPLKWPLGQARDEKKNLGPGQVSVFLPTSLLPRSWTSVSRQRYGVLAQEK